MTNKMLKFTDLSKETPFKEDSKTRISNFEMFHLLSKISFKVLKRSNWFIRPSYSFRFKLPKLKNPFSWVPVLDEVFCNGMLILVERSKA